MKEFLRKSFKTIGSARLIIIAFFILLIIATYAVVVHAGCECAGTSE